MSSDTTRYNVYRVTFSQRFGPNHEALALVPANFAEQGMGRFYHVIGNVGWGMVYEMREAYNFIGSTRFNTQQYVFQIKQESLEQWEKICEDVAAPHDPRALTEPDPDPPTPNCVTWVEEVIREAQFLAVED